MNGFINVFKTPGLTSSDVVVRLRRILNQRKIGHAGTLDPAAAGVLPIMLGKATRLFDYLQHGHKEYMAVFRFGIGTDTLDAQGSIMERSDKPVDEEIINQHISKYIGSIEQIPPKVSAVNINGQRAYAMARKGQDIVIPPKKVNIKLFDLINQIDHHSFLFRILCSKGTYIRSLCRDLAKDMNTTAHLSYLLRTKSGYFNIEQAYTLEQIQDMISQSRIDECIINMDDPIQDMERIDIKSILYPKVINGNPIRLDRPMTKGEYRVYCRKEFIGLGKISDNKNGQILKIHKMLVNKQ